MFRSLRILQSAQKHLQTLRCCSGYVSTMRYLNRLKEDDAACLAALENSHIFLFHRLSPLLQRNDEGAFRAAGLTCTELQATLEKLGSDRNLVKESVLIGCRDQNQAQFCLDVGDLDQKAVEEECGAQFIDLRKAFFLLQDAEAPLVAKGQALLRWHQTNGFCSATGQPTHRNQSGSQRVCASNGVVYYPKMAPVVIVLVSDGKRCLLGRQASFPPGLYSALAGFCDIGETVEETLRRELAEEVGVEVDSFSITSSQHWPFPQSSFMIGCHATVSSAHTQLQVDHTELEDVRWFTLEEINAGLKVKTPPRRGHAPSVWFPPRHALANHLILEWAELQRRSEERE